MGEFIVKFSMGRALGESVAGGENPRTQLKEARERLRELLAESRKTLELTNNIKSTPHYSFQYTPAPRNVTVSVKTYNPRGENEDPLFFPIIAESRDRRTLRSCVTVIEITSMDEEEEDEYVSETEEKEKKPETTEEKPKPVEPIENKTNDDAAAPEIAKKTDDSEASSSKDETPEAPKT